MAEISTASDGVPKIAISEHAGARYFCKKVLERGPLLPDARILVAGCGHGMEAAYIHDQLGVAVDAFDVRLRRGRELPTRPRLKFLECDISELPYPDRTFDIVFYHHVIEHVPDPAGSLLELSRVSKRSAIMFIGTPNRHRVIGSIGAHERSTMQKVKENLRDWKAMLTGKFRNECGAHAGFSEKELDGLLAPYFVERNWITGDYLRYKYPRGITGAIAVGMTAGAWRDFAVPAIYALCRRTSNKL